MIMIWLYLWLLVGLVAFVMFLCDCRVRCLRCFVWAVVIGVIASGLGPISLALMVRHMLLEYRDKRQWRY